MIRVILGRGQIGQLHLEDSGISRRHCEIEPMPDGSFRVKDLNSTNGTYLDGRQLYEECVPATSHLTLGSYLLDLNLLEIYTLATSKVETKATLGPSQAQGLSSPSTEDRESQHREAFAKLESYYTQYNEEVLSIEKNKAGVIGAVRYLPTIIVALLSVLLPREYMIWTGGVAIPTLLVSITLASRLQANYTDRLYHLRESFKNNWVCPACSKSLGANSWQMLKKQGKCPHCNMYWDS